MTEKKAEAAHPFSNYDLVKLIGSRNVMRANYISVTIDNVEFVVKDSSGKTPRVNFK